MKALVIGDVMLDEYWLGDTHRISPEAPVPIIKITDENFKLGGAGNVAANLAYLGIEVTLVGLIGIDKEAEQLKKIIESQKIKFIPIEHGDYQTINKLRIFSGSQQVIRIDKEKVNQGLGKLVVDAVDTLKDGHDLIVLSDYAKGTLSSVQDIINRLRKARSKIIVDPKGNDFKKYKNASVITPNLKEFEQIMGPYENEEIFISNGFILLQQLNLEALLVTRGPEGMSLFFDDQHHHIPAINNDVYDVTGAGDTVIAFFAFGLMNGNSFLESSSLANKAAGVSVRKRGAAVVSLAEAKANQGQQKKIFKETELSELISLLESHKELMKKIVFTNGCFDLLHAGHVSYLNEAKRRGDILCIGVNSDDSVRRLKGDTRPINNLYNRMQVLGGLSAIDYLIEFSEDTPEKLISAIKPQLLVKGADYSIDEVIGREIVEAYGGKVELIDLVEGLSTSEAIKKIKS